MIDMLQEGREQEREQWQSQDDVNEQLSHYFWQLDREGSRLLTFSTIIRDDPEMHPAQCRAAIRALSTLRTLCAQAREFLNTLHPQVTQRVKPYGCITKLATLDYRLTELILSLAMFRPICQRVTMERIRLHLHLRTLVGPILDAFEDAMSQLAALMSKEQAEGRTQL